MPLFSRPQHSTAVSRRPCCAVALRITALSQHGMTSVNQTRLHYVNQMGKTRSKPLAARRGRWTAWERHAMCESAFRQPLSVCHTPVVVCIATDSFICEIATSTVIQQLFLYIVHFSLGFFLRIVQTETLISHSIPTSPWYPRYNAWCWKACLS